MWHLGRSSYIYSHRIYTMHCPLRAMSAGADISEQLCSHIKKFVSTALQGWSGDDHTRNAVPNLLLDHIKAIVRAEMPPASSPRELNKQCSTYAALLIRYLNHGCGDLDKLCRTKEDVKIIIENEIYRNITNEKIFYDITSHHHDIQDKSWDSTVANADDLATYAQAATQMGEKKWVRIANDWIRSSCYKFFFHGGAKKAYIKSLKKANGGQVSKEALKSLILSNNLMDNNETSLGSAFDSKIRMLDVGACYNPLAASESAGFSIDAGVPQDSIDLLGIDLYPANPTVLQCDFLNVDISPPATAVQTGPALDILEAGDYCRVVSLPAESFDAACMCLVLSYLPDPAQRLKMVQNAWALLKCPSAEDGPEPHRTGMLVIVEKISVFGNNPSSRKFLNDWRDEIERVGFDMVSAQVLSGTSNHAYGMIFRKVSRSAIVSGTMGGLYTRRERTRCLDGLDINDELPLQEEEPAAKKQKVNHNSDSIVKVQKARSKLGSSAARAIRVAIVGGGIGGIALAVALQKIKHVSFTVYEKDASFSCRKQGYALTVQQGLSALRILGIDKEVLSAGVVSSEHASYDKFGNLLGIYGPNSSVRESPEFKSVESRILSDSCSDGDSIGSSSEPSSASSSAKRRRFNVHIPRQMLRDIMLRKVDPRCITWGHKVTGCCLDIPSGGARLTFDNGTETVADVVVAADGINSVLRRIFYPDRPLQYLGLLVVLGISKRDDINFNGSEVKYRKVQWVDGTTRVFSMPFDRNNIMWQLSFPIGDEQAALIASETPASLHAAALQMCDGWDTPLIDLIRNTDLCMISGHPVYDLDPSVIYGKESQSHPVLPRVTFVGDSVHPMSPFKGQGANQALADAISLAASLSRLYTGCHDDFIKSDLMTDDDKKSFDGALVSSLIKYESEMRERSISKVLKSRTAAVSLHSEAALAVGNITRAAAAAAAVST